MTYFVVSPNPCCDRENMQTQTERSSSAQFQDSESGDFCKKILQKCFSMWGKKKQKTRERVWTNAISQTKAVIKPIRLIRKELLLCPTVPRCVIVEHSLDTSGAQSWQSNKPWGFKSQRGLRHVLLSGWKANISLSFAENKLHKRHPESADLLQILTSTNRHDMAGHRCSVCPQATAPTATFMPL